MVSTTHLLNEISRKTSDLDSDDWLQGRCTIRYAIGNSIRGTVGVDRVVMRWYKSHRDVDSQDTPSVIVGIRQTRIADGLAVLILE
jgi:hypothetical protein